MAPSEMPSVLGKNVRLICIGGDGGGSGGGGGWGGVTRVSCNQVSLVII